MSLKYIYILFLLLLMSCQNQTKMNNESKEITLMSGVESMLDGNEVICSNIARAEYVVNEEKREGLTANLALPNHEDWLRVGKGNTFELNEKTWVIVEIKENSVIVKEEN